MQLLSRRLQKQFATLALAEHNGKMLTKNTLKLLNASSRLKEEVGFAISRPICLSVDSIPKNC
jgi:hypothetical protein